MTSKLEIKKICITNFINQLSGFMGDVMIIVPDNEDIISAKKYVDLLSKANPKLLLTYWHNSVTIKYSEQIFNNDFEFALNKDYRDDIKERGNEKDEDNESILKLIDNLKHIAKKLNTDQKNIIMKYLQNISKLTQLYFQQ